MSRFKLPSNTALYSQYLQLFVLTSFVLSMAIMVLFGDQGLLVLSDTEERLAQVQLDLVQMQSENKELRLRLRRLQSRPEEIDLLAGELFNRSQNDSTLYVFSSEE